MAFDCFLKIAGIDGESTDDKHPKWIELLAYSHGLTQQSAGTVSGTGNLAGSRTDHADFSIAKALDKASPKLALACSDGTHIPEITVELCRAAGDKGKYMEYKMTNTIVRSVAVSGAGKSEDLPNENVTFGYSKIEWTYTDYVDGKKKGDTKAGWDLSKNKKV